jgi:phage terminase small subunit
MQVMDHAMPRRITADDGLTTKQRKAIGALLTTGEVTTAAREAGVARETLSRWMSEPVFAQAVRDAEARAIDDLSRMLVRLGRTATTTLAKAMSDPATPVATRVRAADVTISRLLQLRELATLEARVTDLERNVGLHEGTRS